MGKSGLNTARGMLLYKTLLDFTQDECAARIIIRAIKIRRKNGCSQEADLPVLFKKM